MKLMKFSYLRKLKSNKKIYKKAYKEKMATILHKDLIFREVLRGELGEKEFQRIWSLAHNPPKERLAQVQITTPPDKQAMTAP